MKIKNKTFEGGEHVIDGNDYTSCVFKNCMIVFKGGRFAFDNVSFIGNCPWRFADAALTTLAVMNYIWHQLNGGHEFIEALLDENVRGKSVGGNFESN